MAELNHRERTVQELRREVANHNKLAVGAGFEHHSRLATYLENAADLLVADSARLAGPEFRSVPGPGNEDRDDCCVVCGLATCEPHTWEDCAKHQAAGGRETDNYLLARIAELEQENARLKRERDFERTLGDGVAAELTAERDAARSQVERLREGLGFYADAKSWEPQLAFADDNDEGAVYETAIDNDRGQRARALLDELGKGRT